MLLIGFRFRSGRYHATPYGRHVNEGAIEWPPSPWRISRALLATGWSRHGWDEVPDEVRTLLATLAAVVPRYHVELTVGAGHTRHYMPKFKDGTDRVIDTFLVVPADRDALVVQWDVELSDAQRDLLAALVAGLPYLGRAESIVDASLLDTLPPDLVAVEHSDHAPGPAHERVDLLAPLSLDELSRWRAEAITRASAAADLETMPPKKRESERAKITSRYPADLVEVLHADSAVQQKAGWSQPPGSRWLTYWRPRSRPLPRHPRATRTRAHVDTAILALAPDTAGAVALPLLRDALLRAELVHKALVAKSSEENGDHGPSSCLTGCDAARQPLRGHQHASVLPVCLNGDTGPHARIDHIVVQAPMGFDDAALAALRQVRKTYAAGLPPIFMTLAGVGRREELVSVVGRGTTWDSTTPFVPPRHLKANGRNTLRGQIEEELTVRGLPPPREVQIMLEDGGLTSPEEAQRLLRRDRVSFALSGSSSQAAADAGHPRLAVGWRHFRLARSRGGPLPPARIAIGLRIEFGVDLIGPLSLGYGAHFGLGQLKPATRQLFRVRTLERSVTASAKKDEG